VSECVGPVGVTASFRFQGSALTALNVVIDVSVRGRSDGHQGDRGDLGQKSAAVIVSNAAAPSARCGLTASRSIPTDCAISTSVSSSDMSFSCPGILTDFCCGDDQRRGWFLIGRPVGGMEIDRQSTRFLQMFEVLEAVFLARDMSVLALSRPSPKTAFEHSPVYKRWSRRAWPRPALTDHRRDK